MIKTFRKDNKELNYKINKKNNKHTYIKLKDNIVLFNAPKNIKEKNILNYLNKNFDILYEKINNRQKNEIDYLTLWDQSYKIIKSVYINNYEFLNEAFYINDKRDLLEVKKEIYYNELFHKLTNILPNIEETIIKHGLKKTTYKLKFLRSKFGSYHKQKNEITLNTYLAKLDEKLLEYVLYHEYAHQKVFNHSKAFYDFLQILLPNYKEYDKALKKIAIYI